MVFGIVYEYIERAMGMSMYIGKASGLYGYNKTLEIVHRRHMFGRDPVPFDFVLRENERVFYLQIVDRMESEVGYALQAMLKPVEKERIRERKPHYNCVRMIGKTANKT